jgi:ectoine hydroxylase-related dioxygenase (phytanoyl-CoA dioxygenase family)
MKYEISVPPIDSPFVNKYVNTLSVKNQNLCREFYSNGYITIDLDLDNGLVSNINSDIKKIIESGTANIQDKHYEYSDSPRVFHGWKHSEAIRQLAIHPRILETLELLYNRKAFPFSTINFTKGAQQPFHSDSIHFQTMPNGWIVGCWVALEDIDENSGPLKIIPGSHKNRYWSYQDLGIPHPDDIKNGEKICYRLYEEFVDDLIKEKKFKTKTLSMKKGQCVIWASELLHGSIEIKDKSKTRKSQAIHYSFNDCSKYFHPMFSNLEIGLFADKWCNEQNNVLTFTPEKDAK